MAAHLYLRVFAVTVLLALATAGLFNVIVDPYRIFEVVEIGDERPAADKRTRTAKPYQVARRSPATILLGNSRTESGLDPLDKAWRDEFLPVYNLAVGGSGLFLQYRFLQHALRTTTPKNIVVGLDFTDFIQPAGARCGPRKALPPIQDFEKSLAVGRDGSLTADVWLQDLRTYRDASLSLSTTIDSVRTVLSQSPDSPTRTPEGFNPNHDVAKTIRIEGHAAVFRHADRTLYASLARGGRDLVVPEFECSQSFQIVDQLLDLQHQKQFNLYLYIHPYHSRFLTLLSRLNLGSLHSQWKTRLAKHVANREAPAGKVRALWDFGVHSEQTSELPLDATSRKPQSKYFWESGHYRPMFGGQIIAAMTGSQNETPIGANIIAVPVSTHLSKAQERFDAFRSANPILDEELDKLFKPRGT